MNGISPLAGTSQPQFKLDTSFEDNFDFAAASKADVTSFTPPSTQSSTVNGFAAASPSAFDNTFLPSVQTTQEQTPPSSTFPAVSPLSDSQTSNKPPTLDDTFGSLSSRVSGVASSTDHGKVPAYNDAFGSLSSRVSAAPSADHGISFDDVFGGGNSTSLGDSLGLPAQTKPEAMRSDTDIQPTPFPPSSPPGSMSSRIPASLLSARSTSPPPRVTSPRPRPSTGSSSDGGVPPSKPPPAQRHSKLSVSLFLSTQPVTAWLIPFIR